MIVAFREEETDPEIGFIVLAGAGDRAFCTGGEQSFSGEVIPGEEAHRLGLVQWCLPPERFAEEAEQIAGRYASMSRYAAIGAEAAIAAAPDPAVDGFALETEVVHTCFESAQTRSPGSSFLAR